MGEPQFPLFGRFKGWGVGAGEIEIPRPDPFFPAAFFGKKAVPPEAPPPIRYDSGRTKWANGSGRDQRTTFPACLLCFTSMSR